MPAATAALTARHAVAAELATAPLTLMPIRRLTTHADRDTLTTWFVEWASAGWVELVDHLDAVHILNRAALAPADQPQEIP